MSKYELTISSNYVKHWGVTEGVREFFQNAIDEQKKNPDHSMKWSYDHETEMLKISNKNCKLEINSLLLGNTSKSDGKSIGQFGEGYKVAIVVLLREEKEVVIHNGNELWNTRFVNSRRYKDKVPVIDISKLGIFGQDLVVEISNITPEEFEEIKINNLFIKRDEISMDKTEYGDVLTDESEKGRIYAEGLFVCESRDLKYGYNIRSQYITLNRDRNLLSDFDIHWNVARIVCSAYANNTSVLYDLLHSGDARYAPNFVKDQSREELFELFKQKNNDQIPVSTQEEYDYFKSKGMSPIIVKETFVSMFSGYRSISEEYEEMKLENSLHFKLSKELDLLKNKIPKENYKRINKLLEDFKYELSEIDTLKN